MIERGEVWTSGGRSVRVIDREQRDVVVVRDSFGLRRRMPEAELVGGFSRVPQGAPGPAAAGDRGVMACRALADVDPA